MSSSSKKLAILSLALLVPVSGWAASPAAATFSGQIYSGVVSNVAGAVKSWVDNNASATNPVAPIVTFTSALLPEISAPGVSSAATLPDLLDGKADIHIATGTPLNQLGSNFKVWHITGSVDLTLGNHVFQVYHNDGMQLFIGGQEIYSFGGVSQANTVRNFTLNQGGVQSFELFYTNNSPGGNMVLRIDGGGVPAATPPISAVPESASVLMMLAGLGGLAFLRRRR